MISCGTACTLNTRCCGAFVDDTVTDDDTSIVIGKILKIIQPYVIVENNTSIVIENNDNDHLL